MLKEREERNKKPKGDKKIESCMVRANQAHTKVRFFFFFFSMKKCNESLFALQIISLKPSNFERSTLAGAGRKRANKSRDH